jgi:hypothetical protein
MYYHHDEPSGDDDEQTDHRETKAPPSWTDNAWDPK